jgi:hypothetical protein
MTDRQQRNITPGKYRKIGVVYVSMENVDISDDMHGVDEQIRCILGMIDEYVKKKGYTEFRIVVAGGYAR